MKALDRKTVWVLFALLAFTVCLRLDRMGKPFIEYFGNRQVQNAIPIRLFLEGRFSVFSLPTQFYDSFGSAEFPVLQLVVASAYRVLEFFHIVTLPQAGDYQSATSYYITIAVLGRIWSLLMVVAALACLYALLAKVWNRWAAFFALFAYALLPLNRFHDQLFITEPTVMALSVFAIYLLWTWSENQKTIDWRFIVSALAVSLALLLKISHVFLFIPLGFLFFKKYRACAIHRWPVWLFVLLAAIPAGYFYLGRTTHVSIGLSDMALRNTLAIIKDWQWTHRMLHDFWIRHWWIVWTPVGGILMFVGMVVAFCQRDSTKRWLAGLLFFWSLSWLYYWIMCGDMSIHMYYQQPSGPVSSAFMGITLAWLLQLVRGRDAENKGRRDLALVAGAVLCVAMFGGFLSYSVSVQKHNKQYLVYWRAPWDQPPMIAGLAADRYIPPGAKIVAGTVGPLQYPLFYYCHRDGWFLPFNDAKVDWETPQEEAPKKLQEHIAAGAQFYVGGLIPGREQYGGTSFAEKEFENLPLAQFLKSKYRLIAKDKSYVIYDLR